MRLSAFIKQLQELAVEAGDQDPVVLTGPDSHGLRQTPLPDATLGMHNPSCRDEEGSYNKPVLSVELNMRHASFDPTLRDLWDH